MVAGFPSWFGRMLRGMRAGANKTLFMAPPLANVPATIQVGSAAFDNGGTMPRLHTDDGDKTSPPLSWRNLPPGTVTVALLVEDADSPTPSPFVHLVGWGLAACDDGLAAGACNGGKVATTLSGAPLRIGRNGLLGSGYVAPDPPPGHGAHRYVFQVYALNRALDSRSMPSRRQLARELRECAIAKGKHEGVYERV